MTIRQIQAFMAVYEKENITAAAEELHISQPSVSLIIKELEAEFGLQLFDRTTKRLRVTSEGRIFYEHAMRIMTQIERMNHVMQKVQTSQSLHLAVGISVGRLIMPKLCKQFMTQYPEIDLQVKVYPSIHVEQFLLEGSADFAILENTSTGKDLVQIPVEQSPLVVIASADHPLAQKKDLSLHEIAACPLLLREKGSDTRVSIDAAFAKINFIPEPIWESHSTMALLNAVDEGLGLSILPKVYVEADQNPHIAILDIDLGLTRTINACYHKTKILSTAALKFIELLKKDISIP